MSRPSPRSIQQLWLRWLVMLLFGYALLEKGFAYLFLGEMLIVLGVIIFLFSGRLMVILSSPILLLWSLFALWGACRTVPFLSRYHFDAIRDAVLWGYGIVAVFIVAFINRSSQIVQALSAYRKFLRWYLFVIPFLLYVSLGIGASLPQIPWSKGTSIIALRSGETAVHLCAAALFLLIFPVRSKRENGFNISLASILWLICISATVTAIMVNSRGGLLAIVAPIVIVSLLKFQRVGWKVAALSILLSVFCILILSSDLVSIRIHGRTFTSENVMQNLASIGGQHGAGADREDTKKFRTLWWAQIVQYTFGGPYRWTGKGFGVNLLKDDQPPGILTEDTDDRSPHNGSMTVLARMGVPGFALWVSLNLTFAISLLIAYRRAVSAGSSFWSGVNLWLLCYWLSAFINMSFDVYLEGPEGGIWFWSIIGFGVAAMRVQAYETRQFAAERRTRASKGVLPSLTIAGV
jgi:O-Antigen ligase